MNKVRTKKFEKLTIFSLALFSKMFIKMFIKTTTKRKETKMKFMTYRELRDQLNKLSDAELANHVQILIEDEFFPVTKIKTSDDQNDVLDPGTHYLVVP